MEVDDELEEAAEKVAKEEVGGETVQVVVGS